MSSKERELAWRVFSNYIGGEKFFIVGRRLSMSEPLHSGNVEYRGGYIRDETEAKGLAEKLNKEEEK